MVRTTKRISSIIPQEVEILRQKREIGESLRYARVIQKAVFPQKRLIEKIFPMHFILLLPKDILSGDFYWLTKKKSKYCLLWLIAPDMVCQVP
jgi:hypothetical protein